MNDGTFEAVSPYEHKNPLMNGYTSEKSGPNCSHMY